MPGITALQHPLSNVDPSASKVCLVVHIGDPIDRTAVNAHPQLNVRMILQRSANLESTTRRFFRTVEEQQLHSISGRHSIEFAAGFRRSERVGVSDDLLTLLQQFNLL